MFRQRQLQTSGPDCQLKKIRRGADWVCVPALPGLCTTPPRTERGQAPPGPTLCSPTTAVPCGEAPPRSAGTMGWGGGRCRSERSRGRGTRPPTSRQGCNANSGCAAAALSFPGSGVPTEPSALLLAGFLQRPCILISSPQGGLPGVPEKAAGPLSAPMTAPAKALQVRDVRRLPRPTFPTRSHRKTGILAGLAPPRDKL